MPSDFEDQTLSARPAAADRSPSYEPELSAGARHHEAGRFREAEQLYRQVLQRDPNNAEALNLLGVLAAQGGHPRDAKDLLAKAIVIDGGNPEFHYNLGLVYQGTGNRDGAIKSYRRAVELRPEYGEAWLNLGGLLLNKGEAEGAEACNRHAVRIAPGNPIAHHNLGTALMVRQDHQEAERCFREAVRLKPDYAEALNGLGLAQSSQGALQEATASFRRALALKPDYAEAHNSLGFALFEQDELDEAIAEVAKALEFKPGLIQARLNLPRMLVEQDRFEEALKFYTEIFENQPSNMAALAGKAQVLGRLGWRDEAEKIVLPFANAGILPENMINIYGAISRYSGRHEDAVSYLEHMRSNEELSEFAERSLHFTLGGLLDDLGRYDQAFEHYAIGNALRPTNYDPKSFSAKTDRIIDFFSAERIPNLPRAEERSDLPSNLPVFIVGTPRSGTSLVEQILSCHPQVYAAGEMRNMLRLAHGLGLDFQNGDPEINAPPLDSDGLTTASKEYLYHLKAQADGKIRVTDKMPYNFLYLGLIYLLFPKARVIHCCRNPLDSCLSCYFQNFVRGNFQTFDLRNVGLYHRQYERLMNHWRDVLDLPILDVSYEAHVKDPERTCRNILAFLDLDWDPACLQFHESNRHVRTASRDQVNQPIYRTSVGRWKNYEAHLAPLKEALGHAG